MQMHGYVFALWPGGLYGAAWHPPCAQQVPSMGQVYRMPYGPLSMVYLLRSLNYRPGQIKQVKTRVRRKLGNTHP